MVLLWRSVGTLTLSSISILGVDGASGKRYKLTIHKPPDRLVLVLLAKQQPLARNASNDPPIVPRLHKRVGILDHDLLQDVHAGNQDGLLVGEGEVAYHVSLGPFIDPGKVRFIGIIAKVLVERLTKEEVMILGAGEMAEGREKVRVYPYAVHAPQDQDHASEDDPGLGGGK